MSRPHPPLPPGPEDFGPDFDPPRPAYPLPQCRPRRRAEERKRAADEVWRALAIGVLSCLVTGLGAWLAFGKDMVSRTEMEHYVQEQGPWVRERAAVVADVNAAKTTNVQLAAQVQSLLVENAKLSAKLDRVLEELSEMKRARATGRTDFPGGDEARVIPPAG